MMTLEEVYTYGRKKLQSKNILEYREDAWYLLEYVFSINRAYYYAHMEEVVESEKEKRYKEFIEKRAKHIPLQHLTGEKYFCGFRFMVNEAVLIPRNDTEVLVEEVKNLAKPSMRILDLCTGSGCILLSLMAMIPDTIGVGVDISDKALDVARKNAQSFNLSPEFVQGDLFNPIEGKFDIVVSNPPYIATDIIDTLEEEVKNHEPMIALDGLRDGLHFYRRIIASAPKYLTENGVLAFEIGYDQAQSVKELLKASGFSQIRVIQDLAGLDRVVIAQVKE